MAEILLQNRGRFNYYNTLTGRFRFNQAIGIEELQQLAQEEAGEAGIQELRSKVERARKQNLSDILFFNRAGEASKHLSTAECVEFFLT